MLSTLRKASAMIFQFSKISSNKIGLYLYYSILSLQSYTLPNLVSISFVNLINCLLICLSHLPPINVP